MTSAPVSGVSGVLSSLDDQQRAAVLAARGPVCILAGAGTGKTRTITHRIAYGILTGAVPAGQLLAVTFTQRAAGEMRGRLRDLGVDGVQARTFHAAALRQLRYFWPRLVGGEMPAVVDRKATLVAQALSRHRQRTDRATVRDVTGELEWAKACMVAPERYGAEAARSGRVTPLPAEVVAAVCTTYEEIKQAAGFVDFDDLLLIMAAGIEAHRDVAEEIRARYRHFVVDEYQDVNPLQQRLLDAWLGERDDLCVVGDASQTIYTFNGASPAYLVGFARRYPAATVVRLERDYRSTPQVVDLANTVIAGARGVVAGARLRLVGQRAPGPPPKLQEYDSEPAEATAVADDCRRLVGAGTDPAQIAVLFRTNAQSAAYEQALAEAEVPYLVRGSERFFDRPEVRRALVLLRGAARSDGETGADDLPGAVAAVLSSAGFSAGAPPAGGAAREQWEGLAAMVRLAEETPAASMEDFVAELAQRAQHQHAPPVRGVTLTSLHGAKGLEWDAVFIVGLTDGMLPISFASTDEQVEEERRLLYVGVTRAREHLQLSWALSRTAEGRRGRRPSRFLDGLIDPGVAGAGRAAGAGRERRGVPTCRVCGVTLFDAKQRKLGRCSGCPGDVDEALFERLREWRLVRSRDKGVPAYVVFTDATLTAIAERRPDSAEGLAEIGGIGPHKLDEYGTEVLDLLRQATVR
ncbi:MAG: ATP-dependent DNA helicase UvrD2 [Actinomycetota bacterium]|nr:ATP-dependent DNA helicase UvrD2 [Actinomycetota bacterium]